MAVIASSNIVWRLSGGATNTDPAASIGGAMSTVAGGTVTPSTLWDTVSGDEASAGDVEYRCIYVRNQDANVTGWINPVLWISVQTPAGDDIALALGGEGKNGTAESPGNEYTAPSGESFTAPSTKSGGISLGVTMTQNEYYPIWIRRSVPASTTAYASNSFVINCEGDSTA